MANVVGLDEKRYANTRSKCLSLQAGIALQVCSVARGPLLSRSRGINTSHGKLSNQNARFLDARVAAAERPFLAETEPTLAQTSLVHVAMPTAAFLVSTCSCPHLILPKRRDAIGCWQTTVMASKGAIEVTFTNAKDGGRAHGDSGRTR